MRTSLPLFVAVFVLSCGQASDVDPGNGGGNNGTGGSNGAGGGSGAGGNGMHGTGSSDSELVSGSRLKAVYLNGADGARAPGTPLGSSIATFWDSQLMVFCTANPVVGACVPTRAAVMVDSNDGNYFADSTCMTTPLGIAPYNWNQPVTPFPGLAIQDPPVPYAYKVDDNNVLTVYPVTGAFSGTAYRWDNLYSACMSSSITNAVLVSLGAPLPGSTFVAFSYAIDQ